MPKTNIIIYQEKDGTVPLLDWLDGLAAKVQTSVSYGSNFLKSRVMTSDVQYATYYGMVFTSYGLAIKM